MCVSNYRYDWARLSLWIVLLVGCSGGTDDDTESKTGDSKIADTETADAGVAVDGGKEDQAPPPLIDMTEGVAEILLIDDFDDGDAINAVDGTWGTFNDSVDNGTSVLWPEAHIKTGTFETDSPGYGETGYAIHIIGTTGTVLGYDYIGVAGGLHLDSGCPLATPTEIDMNYYDGVQFLIKGHHTGGDLDLLIGHYEDGPEDNCTREGSAAPDSLTGYGDYYQTFSDELTEEWTLVRIRFNDMVQREWATLQVPIEEVLLHVKALTWQYQISGGEIDLWIDNVALFKDVPSNVVYPHAVVTSEATFEVSDENLDPAVGTMTDIPVSGQSFTSAKQIAVDVLPEALWDITLMALTETRVNKGELLHADMWVRCVTPPAGSDRCRMTFNFTENGEDWTQSGFLPVKMGSEWTHISLPFHAAESYAPGEAYAGFWLGYPAQTVAIGGFSVTNYGDTVPFDSLAGTEISYEGREIEAMWRADAQERIETHRKGDLTIRVQDNAGVPVPNATVTASMTKHAFGFGTAFNSDAFRYDFGESDRIQYENAVTELFNWLVLEDTLKWPAIAGVWDDMGLEQAHWAVDWADVRDLPVRGHVLVWPGWDNLPRVLKTDYIELVMNNDRDIGNQWLKQTVEEHVSTTATSMAGRLPHWDVLNEPYMNHDLMDLLGPEVMVDWFRIARESDPNAKLFINEYGVIAPVITHSGMMDNLVEVVSYLIEQGAPIDGIGLQGHYYYELMDPEEIYTQLERLAPFQKEIWITEFDIRFFQDEYPEMTADFTRDLLTTFFSHPNAGGFMMWGFWDGSHYGGPSIIYDHEWNEKPSGAVYRDLVFNQWWTDETGTTGADGDFATRGFYGDYHITASANGLTTSQDISLSPDTGEIVITLQ